MHGVDTFSYFKGYTFFFELDDNKIIAWFSCFSGREKIFLNGKVISSRLAFTKRSKHSFLIGDDQYSVELHVKNLLLGPIICELQKNGEMVKSKKLQFRPDYNKTDDGTNITYRKYHKRYFVASFLIAMVLAVALVYAQNYFGYSNTWFYISLLSLVSVSYIVDKFVIKKSKYYKDIGPKITDDE